MAKKAAKRARSTAKSTERAAKKTTPTNEAVRNPVVHFEFPMKKPKRAAKFYQEAFGWNFISPGEEHGGYLIAHTGETDSEGMLKDKGVINGGFFTKKARKQPKHPSVVIAVMDIIEAMKKIEKAGGKIIGKPDPISGYGTFVSFKDSEGNVSSIIEPDDDWK